MSVKLTREKGKEARRNVDAEYAEQKKKNKIGSSRKRPKILYFHTIGKSIS